MLQIAVINQSKSVVELLLDYNADPNKPEQVHIQKSHFRGDDSVFFLSTEQCLHYWGVDSFNEAKEIEVSDEKMGGGFTSFDGGGRR